MTSASHPAGLAVNGKPVRCSLRDQTTKPKPHASRCMLQSRWSPATRPAQASGSSDSHSIGETTTLLVVLPAQKNSPFFFVLVRISGLDLDRLCVPGARFQPLYPTGSFLKGMPSRLVDPFPRRAPDRPGAFPSVRVSNQTKKCRQSSARKTQRWFTDCI